VANHILQHGWHGLLRISEDLNEVAGKLASVRCDVRDGRSFLARTTGSSDAMDVVFHLSGCIVIDDIANVLDIWEGEEQIRQL